MTTLYEEARAVLRGGDFRPKKSRGQNFLVHERVIDAIVGLLDLEPDDNVVEIGPGLGFLTRRLVERAGQIWAVEVDSFLAEQLRRGALGANPKFHLIHGDFLEFFPDDLLPSVKFKLAGNLPYNISTALLFRIFEMRERFSLLALMLQKEVADRIVGKPGTKQYGALSVWAQLYGRVTGKASVSPEAFFPRPKVRSTVLKIEMFSKPLIDEADLPSLRALVRAAFGQRRKTLGNALAASFGEERAAIESWLRAHDIDPLRRGETLSVDEFIRLARALRQLPRTDG